ncbi:MAG: ATP-dependent RNA helicase HrpA [Gammaproteobacteria bacterium]
MTSNISGSAFVKTLEPLLTECRTADLPGLQRKLEVIQGRLDKKQPAQREILKLEEQIERSQKQVQLRLKQRPVPEYPESLPVTEQREKILDLIRQHQVIVLCGETGSGKTTQLPKLCLEIERGCRGRIGHTQPRRIAARSLAARIAEELHTRPGHEVGYKIRFEDKLRPETYIKVMTDGILLAETRSDPDLLEYDTLIIDEAHERSLTIDFLLGYLRQLVQRRSDLKIIITSATIDPQRFSEHFHDAPIIEVSGRTWPVEIRYRPLAGDADNTDRDRNQGILDAVDELQRIGSGDILVFLPGERDIRDLSDLLTRHVQGRYDILPLFGRLSAERQNQIFRAHSKRRVVLATNVAETSLTVPGIHYVIDTGVARISRYNYRTRVQRLPIEPISRASANQRSGRCGRLAAGVCIRLYSEDDFNQRPEFTDPEIQRTDLAAVILQMTALSLGEVSDFPFIDPPDSRYVRDGYRLLQELGALDENNTLTAIGKELAHLPVNPALGRILLAANEYHCLSEILIIVAVLESVDPRERPLEFAQVADEKHLQFQHKSSDFMGYLLLWRAFQEQAAALSQNKLRKWCKAHFIAYMRMRDWQDIHRQLSALMKSLGYQQQKNEADYMAIHQALLHGFLGQVAMLGEEKEYLTARNLKFRIFPGSVLKKSTAKWVLAAERVETSQRYLRTVASIKPEWIEMIAKPLLKSSYSDEHWSIRSARVMAFEKLSLFGLPVVLRRKIHYGPINRQAARTLFIRHALVLQEYRSRAVFAEHNKQLLASLGVLESKSRRPDLLADEDALYDFFDRNIPDHVISGASFERWWKQQKQKTPELLHLQREQIMQHDAAAISVDQYPDHLDIQGIRLPVRYQFTPGQQADGLGIDMPLAALNQFKANDFDWLVPGLLTEKVELLIKSLPKQWRRHFVPVPDFVVAFLAVFERQAIQRSSIIEQLQTELQRLSGLLVPNDVWKPEKLPAHLQAYFYLMDAQGKCIDEGRDLRMLQQRHADAVVTGLNKISVADFQEREITRWDFGDIPEVVEFNSAGIQLCAWPAVTIDGDKLFLRLHDNQLKAESAHRAGLLRLFEWHLKRACKDVRRSLPEIDKQCLQFASVGGCDALRDDIMQAILQAVFLHSGELLRSQDAFIARLESERGELMGMANSIACYSASAIGEYHQLKRLFKGSINPASLAVTKQIQEQLAALVYPGFVSATPLAWLPHINRFIHAARLRLEKLPEREQKDRAASIMIEQYQSRYEKQLQKTPDNRELEEIRWWIEELRVSEFAQSLKTSIRISPQRLDKAWPG